MNLSILSIKRPIFITCLVIFQPLLYRKVCCEDMDSLHIFILKILHSPFSKGEVTPKKQDIGKICWAKVLFYQP